MARVGEVGCGWPYARCFTIHVCVWHVCAHVHIQRTAGDIVPSHIRFRQGCPPEVRSQPYIVLQILKLACMLMDCIISFCYLVLLASNGQGICIASNLKLFQT